MTTIGDIGEFGLIARLTAGLSRRADVLDGVGDDAAVVTLDAGDALVATCDAQVEGTHFRLAYATPFSIGQRALAVNLSDIAAMGATPRYALISLLAPPTLDVAILDGIYAGLRHEADRYGVAIIGGNVARNPERLVLDITLLGSGVPRYLLRRSGAQHGDTIFVTGSLGMAAAGLRVLNDDAVRRDLTAAVVATVLAAQQTPTPRVAAGQWLAHNGVTTAALDISDGLAADLHHLCAASDVGATIDADRIPIDDATVAVAKRIDTPASELALFGGEDYELLFTANVAAPETLSQALFDATGISATPIGTITAEHTITLARAGTLVPLLSRGWDHMIERIL